MSLSLPDLRLLRQPAGGLRRAVAGVAVRRAARRRRCWSGWRSWRRRDWKRRLALAAGAGLIVAAFHALAWPHCLQRLEGVSPEVDALWLSHVREARPVYRHGWRIAIADRRAAADRAGRLGAARLAQPRSTPTCCAGRWRSAAPFARRDGAAAVADPHRPGGADDGDRRRRGDRLAAGPDRSASRNRWCCACSARRWSILIGAGALVPFASSFSRPRSRSPQRSRDRARQPTAATSSARSGRSPSSRTGIVFTFVDYGAAADHRHPSRCDHRPLSPQRRADRRRDEGLPRLAPSRRGAIIAKYRADYLLICPNCSTTTIFLAEAPKGFYAQLQQGPGAGWLTPVAAAEGFAVPDVAGRAASRRGPAGSAPARRARTGPPARRG